MEVLTSTARDWLSKDTPLKDLEVTTRILSFRLLVWKHSIVPIHYRCGKYGFLTVWCRSYIILRWHLYKTPRRVYRWAALVSVVRNEAYMRLKQAPCWKRFDDFMIGLGFQQSLRRSLRLNLVYMNWYNHRCADVHYGILTATSQSKMNLFIK